jgi:hypothetical protein
MRFAAKHDVASSGGDDFARQWMKSVEDPLLFIRQNPGTMSLSRPARARRIWRSRSEETPWSQPRSWTAFSIIRRSSRSAEIAIGSAKSDDPAF